MPSKTATGAFRRSREEREAVILDTAQDLFYARGVHEVGMDELVAATGLGKATVYRLYPTKDALVGAYLQRLATTIFAEIDAVQERHAGAAAPALLEILDAVEHDIRRPGFRGCAFNNASIEFDDRDHPARAAARSYRDLLDTRLRGLSVELAGRAAGEALGDQLAVLIDGAYTNAAHLGPDGPAAAGLGLARELVQSHTGGRS
ncbi:TetR family transcriptional regulator [Intrasporangium oryzae NRRL B-24470]|uniref:TetR family transcriptional regulator n=1 Tax=Intrasporangium oryzae NRRL B-24470 TaxID=1386089 RepID=W9G706_9MICO|nr:TetR/AcrR family transcriptional regulator [Intrasporangium oryzae]EWT01966.1 TetR family transcriptional regulator [Intrasporangium oryzae NRRL B-24470]